MKLLNIKKLIWPAFAVSTLLLTITLTHNSIAVRSSSNEISEKANAKSHDSADIVFEKLSHDFGKVQMGETIKTEFVFHNNGKGNLLIKDVKAG
ncbi:DUF1573 domain-containing protein [bacterium]|nr:DUF1573 domain-containing protein [candidate division CSSED10-310 bacterium]